MAAKEKRVEIERKFLVVSEMWRGNGTATRYVQGYLSTTPDAVVRVRSGGGKAYLTIKGRRYGISRLELEYEVPVEDARIMIDTLCGDHVVHKTRHVMSYEGYVWEVDEFHEANAGLVVAEIELSDEREEFPHPDWLGREVSHDNRYANSYLARTPFSTWPR